MEKKRCEHCGEIHAKAEIDLWNGLCFQCYMNTNL